MTTAAAGPIHVRVVEDEALIAEMLTIALGHHNITVHATTDNFASLLDPEPWEGITVAVVDFMLGTEMSGERVLRWLQIHRPDIRRVLFSAVTALGILPNELIDAAVVKPADVAELVEAIRG